MQVEINLIYLRTMLEQQKSESVAIKLENEVSVCPKLNLEETDKTDPSVSLSHKSTENSHKKNEQ